MSKPDREAVLDRSHSELSIRRQCELLGLARSGVYRPMPAAKEDDLAVMRRLDELFLAHPFLGSRRMAAMLRAEGRPITRKPGQPSLGRRHHLPPDVTWVFVPGRDHRLGEPGSAGMAAFEQHGRLVLP